jgi:hypothetical protein
MPGFGRFQKALLEAAQQHFTPLMEEHREELSETIENHLFELEGPRQLNRQLGVRDQYFGKLFRGFLEISKSIETLEDISYYIRRFPFTGTRITPERYLQFHVESHFAEVYVLRERLSRYVTLFERQFRRDPNLANVEARCNALKEGIATALQGVVALRGQHIHEFRFTDDGIDRLGSIALLSKGSNDEFSTLMKHYYREQRREVKRTWASRTKTNLEAIKQLLDVFFDALYPIAFDQQGAIRYPHGVRA